MSPPAPQFGYRADYKHPVGRFCIGDPGSSYNGFSWEERAAASPVQRQALKDGRIARPLVCGLTGFTKPDDPRGWGYVFMHNEDYNRPLVFHALSRAAHHALHSRFTNPLPWLRLVRKYYRHGAWFTLLTMDPRDMMRHYYDVYPFGQPSDGEVWPEVADDLGIDVEKFPRHVSSFGDAPILGRNPFHHPLRAAHGVALQTGVRP